MPLSPAVYIQTQAELSALAAALADEPLLGIDTESNSLYAYRERVCLVQISTSNVDIIIDPLTIADMSPLAALMASPAVQKVFHAAEYDILTLKRDYGYTFANVFDTMLAARILGYRAIGLGNLLEEHLGIQVDKSHQRDDWGRRPLGEDSLRYAQMDTHYLPQLRDILHTALQAQGRLEEMHELCEDLCRLPPANERGFDVDGFWKIGQPAYLKRPQMAVLKELYLLREQIAENRDCPPFKVLGNKQLLSLAEAMPRSVGELHSVSGIPASFIRRHSADLLAAVKTGRETIHQLGDPPRHTPPDPIVTERYTILHTWRKERALQRGVESDVILSKQTLWDLAVKMPASWEDLHSIIGLGPWRLNTYGAELLSVIAGFHAMGD